MNLSPPRSLFLSSKNAPQPARWGRLHSARYGFVLPFQAAALIGRKPRLLFWSLLPLGLTLTLYFWGIQRASASTEVWLLQQLGRFGLDPAGWMLWLLTWTIRLAVFIASALTFSIASGIIASPFNDLLAEAAEPHCTPPLLPPRLENLSGRLRLILLDLAKTLAATLALLAAFFLSWVPGLNVLATLLACWLVAFQYLSYPQTRRSQGMLKSAAFVLKYPWACLGFGGMITLTFAIPLVSILALPVAVVGGTLLFARGEEGTLR